MGKLTSLEKDNMHRQSELIHVSLGFHAARIAKGHPFVLETGSLPMTMHHGKQGPRTLLPLLQKTGRKHLVLSDDSPINSPISRISWGVTASMWDTLGQMLETDGHEPDEDFRAFVKDESLKGLIEESHRVGEEIQANPDPLHFAHYRGASTLYSGYEVGIHMMTTLAAVKEGLPKDHPFDPLALSRIIAQSERGLPAANMDVFLWKLDPKTISSMLCDIAPLGCSSQKLQTDYPPSEVRCPALRPMEQRARDILSRHDMYDEHRDGSAAVKLFFGDIAREVRARIQELRLTHDCTDEQKFPAFDRCVINRTLSQATRP